jgi:hypothetical protein
MKDMGSCACPRCLMPKSSFNFLGLLKDMESRMANLRVYTLAKVLKAREFIYTCGNTVDGSKVEQILGDGSWVPTIVSSIGFSQFPFSLTLLLAESICKEAWAARS